MQFADGRKVRVANVWAHLSSHLGPRPEKVEKLKEQEKADMNGLKFTSAETFLIPEVRVVRDSGRPNGL